MARSERVPRLPRTFRVVVRRDTAGRFASRGKKEVYQFRRTTRGKFAEAIEVLAERTIVKTTERGVIEEVGVTQGLVDSALFKTNITTKLRNAKAVDVDIRLKDMRDKAHRIKMTMKGDIDSDRLVSSILDALRVRRMRTQYDLQQINWDRAFRGKSAGGFKVGKTASSQRKVVHDVVIRVRVHR